MRSSASTWLIGLTIASCLVAGPALATELYSLDFPGASTLYRMDQVGGAAAAVGPVGLDAMGDLTSDTRPGTETLWGVRIASGDALDSLVTIDPATGAAINSVPITIPAAAAAPGHMTSIAFDPKSGVLYGNTSIAFGAPVEALYTIDPTTGNATFIGRITFDNVFALGFDQSGKLFGVSDATDDLIGIDLVTGNGSFIVDLQVGFAFDIASRPEDDVMFLADSGTTFLYTLDTSNGNLTGVGPYGGTSPNLVGLAFSAIPEPGTALLVTTGLAGLAAAGRKRRAAN